jgi:hypothetical protein
MKQPSRLNARGLLAWSTDPWDARGVYSQARWEERAARRQPTGVQERAAINRRGNDGIVARSDQRMVQVVAGRRWRTLHVRCRRLDSLGFRLGSW